MWRENVWRAGSWMGRLAVILLVLALALGRTAAAQDVPGATTHVDLPVYLDDQELGQIDVEFSSANTLLSVDGAAMLAFLREIILPETYSQIERNLGGKGRLPHGALAALSIGLDYDAAKLELELSIPAEARRKVDVRLGAGDPFHARAIPVTPPADTSAYLNVHTAADYLSGGQTNGWQGAIVDLDGAATLFGTTLEGVGTYRGGAANGWSRGDVRLVHDFPESRIRVTAGDLSYGLDGFQGFHRAGGISIGRAFALQPYRASTPAGETTLLVERRSRVDVLVNGRRVDTLNISPGSYNVRDFPFAPGANDISLRITDDVGRVQTLNFPFIYDSTVLADGEHDFHYALGFQSDATAKGRTYDTRRPLFSFYHAYGITDQFTLGANAQAASDEQLGGLEARWATRLGTFRGDLGASSAGSRPAGYAARLQYRYIDTIGAYSAGRTFELSTSYRSRSFAGLDTPTPDNTVSVSVGARYGQRLFGGVYGAAGFNWDVGRGATRNAYAADVSLSTSLSNALNIYVLFSRSRPAIGPTDNRVFAAISWFPGAGHSVTATHDTRTGTSRTQWHHHPAWTVQTLETDLLAERSPTATDLRAEANYTGYRFKAGVIYDRIEDRTGAAPVQQRANLTFASALAFADGHVAVSRPIADSFALIAPHPALSGHAVEVNPAGNIPQAVTDFLGAAVLPEMTSYYRHQVLLDAPDLPDGMDLGQDFYTIQPRYRSGTVIPAGTGATVLLEADLKDFAGLPLGLELGSVTVEALPGRAPLDFFTSDTGRLRIAGIAPGKITLVLRNYPESPVTIEIPQKTAGVYDAGAIAVPVAGVPARLEK
ncbi:MAG: fimbria/pilus outer membrane usher protein [Rhodospirillaceae bacterium]